MHAPLSRFRFRVVQAILAVAVLFQFVPALAAGAETSRRAPVGGVAWVYGDSETAVEAAFARARSEAKPVLLYWGAAWCPPCNQLKATLFNRRDFIALSYAVIPVYLDGDLPGAQKQGSRFKVVGYPTLILFTADRKEITRLPGEADATRVIAALKAGLTGARPVSEVLVDALSGVPLAAAEWLALAFYAWETDEAKLVNREERAGVLVELARRSQAVSAEASTRLWLKALVARDAGSAAATRVDQTTQEQTERLLKVLGDPDATRLNADVIMEGAKPILKALTEASDAGRAPLLVGYTAALVRLQNDGQLSRADRTGALIARVDLARLDVADDAVSVALPPSLLVEVKALAKRMDAEITDGFERQAVITSVAHLLGEAGLWSESDALLKANLKRSHAPYYLMSQLGRNARKMGRKTEALAWYESAYRTSKGPATRLQWGANYIAALVDLAPQESERIEKAVLDLFADAAKDQGAYYERSGRSLRRVTAKISSWNESGAHAAEVARLRARHRDVCQGFGAADPQRKLCEGLWSDSKSDIAAL